MLVWIALQKLYEVTTCESALYVKNHNFLLMTKPEYDELVSTLLNLTINEVRDAVRRYSDEEYDI